MDLSHDSLDLSRLRAAVPVAGIEHHARLESTNDRALELVAKGDARTPCLIVADEQTAGRGRGANSWWSSEGALTFSLIVAGLNSGVEAPRRARVSLVAGLAVCDALHPLLSRREVRLKWPNDVFVDGRKVCGILVEAAPDGPLVIGVGINANNTLVAAPEAVRGAATSIRDLLGRPIDRTALLADVIRMTLDDLESLHAAELDFRPRWSERCLLTGRLVQVDTGGRVVAGLCRGIDSDGALLLHTEAGPQRIVSGVAVRIDE